jgi:hypothetical protein
MLHLLTETLAAAASGRGPQVPAQLAETTWDLLTHLERHLSNEEAVLADGGADASRRMEVTRRRAAR